MKKIEYSELRAMGASDRALKFYSGCDAIRDITRDGDTYTIRLYPDGPREYRSAGEMIADLEDMAREEAELTGEEE